LYHPVLNQNEVDVRILSEILFEAFVLTAPFERSDVHYALDNSRLVVAPYIEENDRFIAIYDQTYGSLRLTNILMQPSILPQVFEKASMIARFSNYGEISPQILTALEVMEEALNHKESNPTFGFDDTRTMAEQNGNLERIILPGSKGLNLDRGNEEFLVEGVGLTELGLRYRGVTKSLEYLGGKAVSNPFVSQIAEIPGVSQIGLFNLDTGEIEEGLPPGEDTTESETALVLKHEHIDTEELKYVLCAHFDENDLERIMKSLSVLYNELPGDNKKERVEHFIQICEERAVVPEVVETSLARAREKLRE
jgi:DEAD/DEAH box helicase domain-containing protein